MFKINHFANSFITIQSENSTLACDPWIGETSDNGWYSYPIKSSKDINNKVFDADFVYISHLHCDHLDFKTLKKFKNRNLVFIIKKFSNGILKKRLQNNTGKKILELEPFKKVKINNFVKKIFKRKIDIFCYPLGAACEFPQCFLNLNRAREQKKLVKNSLNDLKKYLSYLKPKVFFPAGGTYAIYGKFHKLNKYIAQPSFPQIKSAISHLNTKVYNIIGGGYINFMNSNCAVKETNINIANSFDKSFVSHIKNKKYYYEKKEIINLNLLDTIFDKAKLNYFRVLAMKKGINTKWDIYFNIFKKYELNKQCQIDEKKSQFLKRYQLSNHNSSLSKVHKLECYLEYSLFKSLLSGRFPWNTTLTGSTIMYKRTPNIFNVDQQFSLNFLRA